MRFEDGGRVPDDVVRELHEAQDRLMVPVTGLDPFADEGSYFLTGQVPEIRIVPDVAQAYVSRQRVVRFFVGTL